MTNQLLLRFFCLLMGLIFSIEVSAQKNESFILKWNNPIEFGLEGEENQLTLNFDRAQYSLPADNKPYFSVPVLESSSDRLKSAEITNAQYETLSPEETKILSKEEIPSTIEVETFNATLRKRNQAYIKLLPLRKNGLGEIEKLVSFDLEFQTEPSTLNSGGTKTMSFASQSKLRDGDWYKIAVVKDAVFKLNYDFLNNLGIDLGSIDPRNIQLYGYGGGMLPESNEEDRPDDLVENAIVVVGEQDGAFNRGDYILFYGEDQVEWEFHQSANMFRHSINRFSDTTYYFLTVGNSPGKRVPKESRPSETPTYSTSDFDGYDFHEVNRVNLLKSGRSWFGEGFDNQLNYTFNFNFPSLKTTEDGKIDLSVVARSGAKSNFTLTVNNQSYSTSINQVNLNNYAGVYAYAARNDFDFTPPSGNNIAINLRYDKPQSVSRGWLNHLSVNVRRGLNYQSEQLTFRDIRSVGNDFSEFLIQSSRNIKIWDITDNFNIVEKEIARNGNQHSIITESENLREFIAFDRYDSVNVFPLGQMANQNLHGMPQADYIIITHPLFKNQANRLADIHAQEGLSVNVVTPQEIYNEFSSGSQDLIAIRSYIKMLYDRATNEKEMPKYVLMFGDASYDYKNRVPNNTNLVPAYQSRNSLNPVTSYVSDDYFALLDDDEGEWRADIKIENLDVAIGRFSVNTTQQADGVVDKVARYLSSTTLGDWRNEIVFVADDEDSDIHMGQAEQLSKIVDSKGKSFVMKKIYLDAYQKISTASGERYPTVNRELNKAVQRGALFVNYTGHGGETGWTAERVLGVNDITSWENLDNMPVFITATCEFSRFDDPVRTSAGELVLLNSKGGGIGLMTTTRLVYSSPNYILNRAFYDRVFQRKPDGSRKRLGDIFQEVKNSQAASTNSRNFSLLGDPALPLAMPHLEIITTELNEKPINEKDTISALSKVTVSGYIANPIDGTKMENFNGTVFPTVFDKVENKETLNNDGGKAFEYEDRDSRVFKGKASVSDGEFTFSFVVPKDISYSYGEGKINYYATDGNIDANGYTEDFIIGGSNEDAMSDEVGPEIEIFLNDRSFVYGGITSPEPILLVDLFDEQGINTVGGGIGHDLVAILDENTENAIILNDFYEAEEDDYKKGQIRYPFDQLSEGKHTITIKAWDVANNSSEKMIEFEVLEDKEVEITNLVNYPNPFTTNTEFIFQHNQAGIPLDVKLEVFTVSGKLVKSFNQVIVNDGFLSRDIRWDGRDDFGDKIGKGVYVYKIKVRSRNGSSTEKFEKLVIL